MEITEELLDLVRLRSWQGLWANQDPRNTQADLRPSSFVHALQGDHPERKLDSAQVRHAALCKPGSPERREPPGRIGT